MRVSSPVARPVGIALALALVASVLAGAPRTVHGATPAPIPASADWLTVVNYYRAMASLPAVAENPAHSAGALAHSRYMVLNRTITHDEIPGAPGYSTAGDEAAKNGNVAVSSTVTTARSHIEQWIRGPFHAIGLLRPELRTVGFGHHVDSAASPWRSAATLDVLRGLDASASPPAAPVVFPGNGSTTHLSTLTPQEHPDARALCGWTGDAGLPLLALFPTPPGTATATLTGPSGPIPTCTLGAATVSDSTARSVLGGANAIAVIPRSSLAPGSYQVRVTTSSGATASWGFSVDPSVADGTTPSAPLPTTAPTAVAGAFTPSTPERLVDTRLGLGTSRLVANRVTPIDMAGRRNVPGGATAISANVTVVEPAAAGYVTVYPCGPRPEVSTVNFKAGRTIANAALLPLDGAGDLCAFSTVDTHLLIDVNGSFWPGGSDGFVPVAPDRILDTRHGIGGARRQAAGGTVRLRVRGVGGVPMNASAVALTVTAVDPGAAPVPYVTVYPCGARPETSNLNLTAGETRPNQVIVPVSPDGDVCLFTTAPTDLLADLSGWFVAGAGRRLTPLVPIRMVDTRQADARVNAGSGGTRLGPQGSLPTVRVVVAGQRGVPVSATAVSANLTVADAAAGGFVTAYPCGTRPTTSNLNFAAKDDTAAATQLMLDAEGAACFYVSEGTHLIVDVNGAWA